MLQITVSGYRYGRADRPRFVDFSTGYGNHKGQFGNLSRRETKLLALPATLRNRPLVSAFRLKERFSRAAVSGLDKLGVTARLRRLIGRTSSRGAQAE